METKRLFIASFVAEYLFARHISDIQNIFANSSSGKWSDLNNLHFTYKFLGNVEINKIPEIIDLMKDLFTEYPSIIKFNKLGLLKSRIKPQVLYSSIYNADKSVFNNFKEIENRLVKYGFPKEKQKFMPHVTLLRIKKFEENFFDVFEQNKEFYIGKQQKYKINLVSSTLTHSGPIYEILA